MPIVASNERCGRPGCHVGASMAARGRYIVVGSNIGSVTEFEYLSCTMPAALMPIAAR
jgi:hypothetical protein